MKSIIFLFYRETEYQKGKKRGGEKIKILPAAYISLVSRASTKSSWFIIPPEIKIDPFYGLVIALSFLLLIRIIFCESILQDSPRRLRNSQTRAKNAGLVTLET